MSYVECHQPAPFGAVPAKKATTAFSTLANGLRRLSGHRPVTVSGLSPTELEDIGLSVADLPTGRVSGAFARVVAAFRDWDARRRTVSELSRLSDAQLADIGLLRVHIEDLRNGRALT